MKNKNYYGIGMPFESFMRRALKTHERSTRKGTCCSIYETLIRIEDGNSLVKISYNKQLETVKRSLKRGFISFLKRKLNPEEVIKLENLKLILDSANQIAELDYIIDEGLKITMPYKNWGGFKND